jgi:DNA modification methylase
MTEEQIEVRYVPIGDVHPWDKNPKKHNIPAIIASIKRFGRMKPISVQKGTMMVIAGHGRLEAMKKMGFETIPITEHDMPDAEAKAYALVDNETTISGGWDDKLLKLDLQDIKLELPDLDMSIFGFSEKQTGITAKEDDFDADAALKQIEEPITKLGDVITLGEHRLMCGDSTKREFVVKLMGGAKAKMVFTDPPYNCNYGSTLAPEKQSKTRKATRNIWYENSGTGQANASILNDNMNNADWETFCRDLYAIYKEFSEGDIYQWGASGPDGMRSRVWLVDAGCHWSSTIVWNKQSIVMSPANYHRQYEPCFYGWFDKSSYNYKMNDGQGRANLSEMWDCPKPSKSDLHPTMKPIEICAKGVGNSSQPGDIVLDLFGGSGSTLIACEQTGRKCYMMELDPVYCDVIVKRWEELTGKKAVRPSPAK